MTSRSSVPDRDERNALKALRTAVRDAIREHHRAGHPVAVGRNGRVYLLHPNGRLAPLRNGKRAA